MVSGEKSRQGQASEAFFSWPSLASVGVFVLNNLYMKRAFPGFITGKLSDAAAAFFLPLFISALMIRAFGLSAAKSITYGTVITLLLFILVKGTEWGSALLNQSVAILISWTGLVLAPNLADPSDLIVLPLIAYSWHFAHRNTDRS